MTNYRAISSDLFSIDEYVMLSKRLLIAFLEYGRRANGPGPMRMTLEAWDMQWVDFLSELDSGQLELGNYENNE